MVAPPLHEAFGNSKMGNANTLQVSLCHKRYNKMNMHKYSWATAQVPVNTSVVEHHAKCFMTVHDSKLSSH